MMVTSETSRLPVEAPALTAAVPLTAAVAVTAVAATVSGSVRVVRSVDCAAHPTAPHALHIIQSSDKTGKTSR
jgi:hypothetical protein